MKVKDLINKEIELNKSDRQWMIFWFYSSTYALRINKQDKVLMNGMFNKYIITLRTEFRTIYSKQI